MREKIPVRIGWELWIPVLFIITYSNFSAIKNFDEKALQSAIILLFVLLMFVTIRYYMDADYLYIRNSFFGTTRIDIKEIYKIEKTWNLISAPAPGIIGRVEIYYGNNSIIISPKYFETLKQKLLKINPTIIIKE